MEDRYLHNSESVRRLVNTYKEKDNLIVAFDFDNTIFDVHDKGDSYPKVKELLKRCQQAGLVLVLFTSREGDSLTIATNYCDWLGIFPSFINEYGPNRKPNYDILLDDRAGLKCSYKILQQTLNIIESHL